MNYHVLTLFPEMIINGLNTSILGRAIEKGTIHLEAVDIRDYTEDKHRKVDDYPYGGGAGMVMQAEPVFRACEAVQSRIVGKRARVIYVTPQGRVFHQAMAKELSREEDLIFLCGHYEGIDERVLEEVVTDYISIGDYVLTGGELPAMVMIDAISRLVPGVLSNEVSAEFESFHDSLLEYPQYSRPEVWNGKPVPRVLLSGDHDRIEDWRREQSILRTKERRPDLYGQYQKEQKSIKNLKNLPRKRLKVVLMEESVFQEKPIKGEIIKEEGTENKIRKDDLQSCRIQEFQELVQELGLKLKLVSGKEPERFRKALETEKAGKREVLVFTSSVQGVLEARKDKLRTIYFPADTEEQEPKELIYYRKISDLLEGMAVLRRLV